MKVMKRSLLFLALAAAAYAQPPGIAELDRMVAAEMAVAAARGCDAAMPRVDGRAEPVCAAYRRSALPVITAALDGGHRRAADLAARLDVTWLEGLDPEIFRSLNTLEDYERFHDAFAAQR